MFHNIPGINFVAHCFTSYLLRRTRRRWLANRKTPRVVHILNQDKFVPPFVEFVNNYLNVEEHLFVITCGERKKFPLVQPLPNVIDLIGKSKYRLKMELEEICRSGSIIVHCLADMRVAKFFNCRSSFAKRTFWLIWGHDMYRDLASDEFPEKGLRTEFANQIAGLLVVSSGDRELANTAYGSQLPGRAIRYPLPTGVTSFGEPNFECGEEPIVQVNNSCDLSTVPVLHQLAAYHADNFKVRVIHSYGQTEHSTEIERVGNTLFGQRFQVVKEYLPPDEYAKLLAEANVLILNQPRQQGLGNVLGALYAGCKVYIRSDVSSYPYLAEELGLTIHDTNRLPSQLESLLLISRETQASNSQKALRLMDWESLASVWSDTFLWMESIVENERHSFDGS